MTHIDEDLPLLLSGEATRQQASAAAAHLRECDDCRQQLVSAVAAHAALASAVRFAPELVRPVAPVSADQAAALPDFTPIRAAVESGEGNALRRRLGSRRLLVAAAAAVVIGGGAAIGVAVSSSNPAPQRSVALASFGTGHASGTAVIKGESMTVDAASLPTLDAAHRYEVWLTNDARNQMQPIGWIGASGDARLTVPANLMSTFGDIEVSVQSVDAPSYQYSGTSVLRGTY
ncbi:MAG TPA: zf-HC2 domain-containing protein [Jatrophihabitantaceae bacterium]|jgi:anti-sigma factor RsiW